MPDINEKPVALPVTSDNIPQYIKSKKQWVDWGYEFTNGRWTKIPYIPDVYDPEKHKARSNDPKTWGSFEDAFKNYNNPIYGYDGIGFQPSAEDDVVGIDLDHVVDENNGIKPEFEEVVRLFNSYTEITPSGTGLRIFIRGKLPGKGRKNGSFEVYDKSHYLSVTGYHCPDTPSDLEERQEELNEFLKKYFQEEKGDSTPKKTDDGAGISFLSDKKIIEKATKAKNNEKFKQLFKGDWSGAGYKSQSEADSALCFNLAFWTNKNAEQMDRLFRESGLFREKWDEKHGSDTYGNNCINNAIELGGDTYTPKGLPQQETLIKLALDNIEFFFTNQYKEPHCFAICGDHKETIPIESPRFKLWLQGLYYQKKQKGCNPDAIKSAVGTLAAKALFDKDSQSIKLHNRVAFHNGDLYYDLSDPRWRSIRITPRGWELVDDSPCIFTRYRNQKPQVEPSRQGDINLFLLFVNVSDESTKLLILVWIIAAFIPDFPHTILNIHGSQGSAKSCFCKLSKRTIDPGTKETDALPKSQEELIKKLNNSWFTAFDNLGQLSVEASDILCRAITGEGHSERLLYSNNDEVILAFQRVVSINGINSVATLPDILDRCLTVSLERISTKNRKLEKLLDREFANSLPEILGGLFDILSKALALYPEVEKELKELPRMADFAVWGYSIAEAMGGRGKEFLDAYYDNIGNQNFDVVNNHPVAMTLMKFIEDECKWQGTSHDLLRLLEEKASDIHINTHEKGWPKNGQSITRSLNRIKTNLNELGIMVETGIRSGDDRLIKIRKREETDASKDEPKVERQSAANVTILRENNCDIIEPVRKVRPKAIPVAMSQPSQFLPLLEGSENDLKTFETKLNTEGLVLFMNKVNFIMKSKKISERKAKLFVMDVFTNLIDLTRYTV